MSRSIPIYISLAGGLTGKYASATPLVSILVHSILMVLLFYTGIQTGQIAGYPSDGNLVNYDALWYESVVKQGYYYIENEMNTMAFFPLFPYIWKLTGLGPAGISICNAIIYLSAMYIVLRHLRLSFPQALLALSTPSLFFCYIPYSESMFFLGSTFMLIGLNRKKTALMLLGTFLTSITRSVGIVFLPAFIFILLAHWKKNNELRNTRQLAIILWNCSAILVGTFLVMLLQYIQTGEWLVFFKVQQNWNRSLSLPTLPFTTLSGANMLWLDGIALFAGMISILACVIIVYQSLLKHQLTGNSRGHDFSFAYIAIMTLVCSFFSGVWNESSGTSLMSLNRYVFAGPFMVFFLDRMIFHNTSPSRYKERLWLGALLITAWLLTGIYSTLPDHTYYWQTLVYFICMTLYLSLYYFVRVSPKAWSLLYVVNLVLQLYLFNTYLTNRWVG